ncbi:MAG: DUF192 domain-containing protein [Deltaproteobacteria bacterium]|nr:DUF192 domain-containing protein [Deltaproteobacteria bacterium]
MRSILFILVVVGAVTLSCETSAAADTKAPKQAPAKAPASSAPANPAASSSPPAAASSTSTASSTAAASTTSAASSTPKATVPPAPGKPDDDTPPPLELPRGQVAFETPRGRWTVDVEVAASEEARARGLMFRPVLDPDAGMLFVFEETRQHGFWMHNTLIGLDMVFLDEDRNVVGIVARARPHDDTPVGVRRPSRYCIELNAGAAEAHGVIPGVHVDFVAAQK